MPGPAQFQVEVGTLLIPSMVTLVWRQVMLPPTALTTGAIVSLLTVTVLVEVQPFTGFLTVST